MSAAWCGVEIIAFECLSTSTSWRTPGARVAHAGPGRAGHASGPIHSRAGCGLRAVGVGGVRGAGASRDNAVWTPLEIRSFLKIPASLKHPNQATVLYCRVRAG